MVTIRKGIAAVCVVLTLLVTAGIAGAAAAPAVPAPARNMVVSGTLEYVTNLESPHYEVGGWAITAPDFAVLSQLAGREVTVTGRPYTGTSLLMRRQLVVSSMTTTLAGILKAVDGRYELEGFTIRGLEGQLQALDGARVQAAGAVVWRTKGPPTFAVKDLQVDLEQVLVQGKAAALPVPAATKNGSVMLPLRAVIEAAGGTVAWDQELWAVRVTLGDRSTTIRIGSISAESAQLTAAPYLEGGHTMAPLDLFAQVGLDAAWADQALHLK
ncbi:MAG: hypothetical protein K0R39_4024 [Symbiobacteriaceae bacterium]|nr:hypothetical protein [Symbiobacteriaceae bacterium]